MIVLLPVFQPQPRLGKLIAEVLVAAPHARVVVVDDGSAPAAAPVLDEAAGLGAVVLRHGTNRGKGVALKTGFRYAADELPGHDVVCADADGQHHAEDIVRIAGLVAERDRMVLGVRRFDGEVPWRSRFGNAVTQALFRAATGRPVTDTQTGLRGYPHTALPWLLTVPGERFEYEMNVLLAAAREGRPIDQEVIPSTYLNDNASSHFGAFSDSARIYWPLLRCAAAALVAPAKS
ncbi:glycosyltransferase family 2 protein [Micromonosporaceae bacterium Da 78-11]